MNDLSRDLISSELIHLRRRVAELETAEQGRWRAERQLQAQTAALVQAEQRERRRIALGLHDQVGQALALARIRLSALRAAEAHSVNAHDLDEML